MPEGDGLLSSTCRLSSVDCFDIIGPITCFIGPDLLLSSSGGPIKALGDTP